MSGELFQGDGSDIWIGEGEAGSEEIAKRGGEGESLIDDRLREEKAGEDLADGADLKEVALGGEVGEALAGEVAGGLGVAEFSGDNAACGERGDERRGDQGEGLGGSRDEAGEDEGETGPEEEEAHGGREHAGEEQETQALGRLKTEGKRGESREGRRRRTDREELKDD